MAPVNDSGNSGGREIGNDTDQRRPKQFDPTRSTSTSKWLEHLASAKVGEELLDRGFEKHLGYGITDIAIKGIEEGNLCVYKKDGIYYITTSDKAQKYIGDRYKLQTIHGEVNQDMDLIEELEKNLDKIMWDLPNIHAIRTVKKEHWYKDEHGKPIEYWKDEHGKPIEYWKDEHADFPSGQRPEVLITDQEDIVRERMMNPRTESGKEGWKAVLPWASPEFEISSETKDKNIYKENKNLLENIDEKSEYYKEIIEREKDFIKLYYNSDSYIRKEVKNRYIDGINLLKNILTDERIRNVFPNPGLPGIIRDNIKDFLDKMSREIQDLGQRLQPIVHGAIKTGLSNLGLEELQQSKILIKGDLYLHQGNSLTDRPSETSVPVDVEQLKKIEKESGKVKCALKVYVIQQPDQTSAESGSKDKKPEILVTDERNLVARRIKQGWKALPGTQIGIELGNEELKQIYDAYNKLSKETDDDSKHLREKVDLCDQEFGKLYWNSPEKYREKMENDYQKFKKDLKEKIYEYLKNKDVLAIQGLNKIIDTFCDNQNISKVLIRKENLLERDKIVSINNKRNDIFKQLNDKFANSLKKLPGWDKLEIGMEVKVPGNSEITVYSDKNGTIYYVSDADSAKRTQSSAKLQRKDLSGLNPSILDDDNVQWAIPEIHAIQKSVLDTEGEMHTRIFLTNDKDLCKQDGWKHLGTCDSFFSSRKDVVEKIFFNICKTEYKNAYLYYYERYNWNENTTENKIVKREFQEREKKFKEFLKDEDMRTIKEQVIKEWKQRIGSSRKARGRERTSETPKEGVANSSTSEVQSRKQNEKVEKINEVEHPVKYDKPSLLQETLKERIEEEIAVIRAYYDLLHNIEKDPSRKKEQHDTTELKTASARANEILQKSKNINYEQYKKFQEDIISVNQTLKRVAEGQIEKIIKKGSNEQDLKPFQFALRRAMLTIRSCDSFAKKLYGFDFAENWSKIDEWLEKGVRELGVEPENIRESYKKLLTDDYAQEIINERVIDNKVVRNCQPDKIVETYESFIRASANLKDISDKLQGGIPIPKKPLWIRGRHVLWTPGDGNNCLINSLIAVGNPGLLKSDKAKASREDRWSDIQEKAKEVRKYLVDERLSELDKELNNAGQNLEEIKDVLAKRKRQRQLELNPNINLDYLDKFEAASKKAINSQVTTMQREIGESEKIIQSLTKSEREITRLHENRRMLNTDLDLPKILEFLVNRGWIERDRGVVIYEWKNGKMLPCRWPLEDKNPQGPHYAVLFLPNESDPRENHFEVMIRPEELDMSEKEITKTFWEKDVL